MPAVSVHKKQEHYEVWIDNQFMCSCDSSELREAIAEIVSAIISQAHGYHNMVYQYCQ